MILLWRQNHRTYSECTKVYVETPQEYITTTLALMKHDWLPQHQFTLPDIEYLTGWLRHIVTMTHWILYLLLHCYMSIAAAQHSSNAALICTSSKFREMLRLACNSEASKFHQTYVISYKARAPHNINIKYNMNHTLKHELKLIYMALIDPAITFRTPIAHLIRR